MAYFKSCKDDDDDDDDDGDGDGDDDNGVDAATGSSNDTNSAAATAASADSRPFRCSGHDTRIQDICRNYPFQLHATDSPCILNWRAPAPYNNNSRIISYGCLGDVKMLGYVCAACTRMSESANYLNVLDRAMDSELHKTRIKNVFLTFLQMEKRVKVRLHEGITCSSKLEGKWSA